MRIADTTHSTWLTAFRWQPDGSADRSHVVILFGSVHDIEDWSHVDDGFFCNYQEYLVSNTSVRRRRQLQPAPPRDSDSLKTNELPTLQCGSG
jgi:hypothetical protein